AKDAIHLFRPGARVIPDVVFHAPDTRHALRKPQVFVAAPELPCTPRDLRFATLLLVVLDTLRDEAGFVAVRNYRHAGYGDIALHQSAVFTVGSRRQVAKRRQAVLPAAFPRAFQRFAKLPPRVGVAGLHDGTVVGQRHAIQGLARA